MASGNDGGTKAARLVWAAVTPIALAVAFILAEYSRIGLLLIPIFCLYLDGRSRTWTAAVFTAAGCVAMPLAFGFTEAPVFAFAGLATAAAYALARAKVPFRTGLAGSAVGGVLGATAMLGILGAALGKPLNTAVSEWLLGSMRESQEYGDILGIFAWLAKQNSVPGFFDMILNSVPPEIARLSTQEKVEIVRPYLEELASLVLPGITLVAGLLVGSLGYYVPQLALHVHRRRGVRPLADGVDVPPFASFKLPRYVVISVFVLQFLTSLFNTDGVLPTISVASTILFEAMLTVQALALFSFLLNRKRVPCGIQVLILGAALLLFFWILYWVGFFDALFDLRTAMAKMDLLRARGRQGSTQGGPRDLRRTDQSRRDGKNGRDGEDGKQ